MIYYVLGMICYDILCDILCDYVIYYVLYLYMHRSRYGKKDTEILRVSERYKYPLVSKHGNGKMEVLLGNSLISGPFSIAMFDYRRVYQFDQAHFMFVLSCHSDLKWATFG